MEFFNCKINLVPTDVTIDDSVNAAYIRFCSRRVSATTDVTSDRAVILIDYDLIGNMVGIEIVGFDDVRSILEEIGIQTSSIESSDRPSRSHKVTR